MFMKSYRQITALLSSVFTLCIPKIPHLALFSLPAEEFLQSYKSCSTIIKVNIGLHINTRNRKMPQSWQSQGLPIHTCPCTSNNLKKNLSRFDGKINLTPERVIFAHWSCWAKTDTSQRCGSCYSSPSSSPRVAIPALQNHKGSTSPCSHPQQAAAAAQPSRTQPSPPWAESCWQNPKRSHVFSLL